ncbi:IDEAL domain-containing protein [Brevibacillus fulvus]|uniref:Uncharacterized protein YpiB (UPF0302 family) n=1 Tax=Brevibacillus fulvus TaxID=1125967 RepID=A0A938XZF8_9BACL|nr:IDEAL domain-containing protein [Brevibacillus fulvus]MBM7588732.1 uncharacterized protein YpiB (UPF0302 family) [Brevibacillus fulvus]
MDRSSFYGHNMYYGNNSMVAGLLSELVMDEQVRSHRKKTLYEQIDRALAKKDKEEFLLLTTELKAIIAYEQTETG